MPRQARVILLKQIKHDGRWIPAPALFDSKGRRPPRPCPRAGQGRSPPRGRVFHRMAGGGETSEAGRRPDAFAAAEAARHKQAELSAVKNGIIPAQPAAEPEPERTTVTDALDRYSEYIQYHRSLRTFRTYRPILASFKSFCTRNHIEDVDREDLLAFATHCLKQGHNGKTVYNKLVVLSQLLKRHGKPKVLNAADWPSFVETVRPIYEDSEMTKLFKACAPMEEIRFKFYLMSGFRDAEGRFVTWRDVDFRHTAIRVTAKPPRAIPSEKLGGAAGPGPAEVDYPAGEIPACQCRPGRAAIPERDGQARRRHAGKTEGRRLARQAQLRPLRRAPPPAGRHHQNQPLRG